MLKDMFGVETGAGDHVAYAVTSKHGNPLRIGQVMRVTETVRQFQAAVMTDVRVEYEMTFGRVSRKYKSSVRFAQRSLVDGRAAWSRPFIRLSPSQVEQLRIQSTQKQSVTTPSASG